MADGALMRVAWRRLAGVVTLAVLVVACGGGSSADRLPAASGSTPHTVALDEHSAGRTVDVHVGDTVTATLQSTYWSFTPMHGRVLTRLSAPTVSAGACPAGTHVMGAGCGEASESLKATAPGSAVVAAHRSSCGEALRCTGGQAAWTVTVRVLR